MFPVDVALSERPRTDPMHCKPGGKCFTNKIIRRQDIKAPVVRASCLGLVDRADEHSDTTSHVTSEQGIISAAIANAVSLPSAARRGKENVSLLEQQASRKPSSSKTQFTFTCESDSGKNMAWHEQPPASQAVPTYSHLGNSKPPSDQTINQSRGFATQGTQTSPHTAAGQNQEAPFQGSANQPAPQKPRKPRRSLAKQLTMAARQRRLQQEYDNYHHPPAPEDTWICEFCEYEMIFGSPPEALIRQYELKDRQDRRRLAEKRRLLAKAKMKGRKGKKGTKNAAKNANAANTAQQSAPTQRHEPPPDKTSVQNYSIPSEECVAEAYDDDPPPNPAPLPQTPSRIPQPIAHAQHQSLRSATNPAGNAVRAC